MHLRLPESSGPAGSFVPVRRGLQLRPDVHLQRLPARERTASGEPVMHADTGLLAVMGSVCMMLALVLAWCLAGVRSSRFVKKCFPNPQYLLKAHLDFLMTPFGALMVLSFTATTVGYGGAAWYVAHAIVHTAY
jgi:hypothetical protein